MTLIYKILTEVEWVAARKAGRFEGSAADLSDGFIHFSTGEQAPATARRHFLGRPDLMVLLVDAAALGSALKWEAARGGALFPHLFGPLDCRDVIEARAAPLGADGAPDLGALIS